MPNEPETQEYTPRTATFIEEREYTIPLPDTRNLVTEDDTPVDNLYSAKAQRLLVEPLYTSWDGGGRDFLACSNVGIYYGVHQSAIVPDAFLSMDVQEPKGWWDFERRSYFTWEFGKPPDVAIEIVSNTKGNELGSKLRDYAKNFVRYYAVFDPQGYYKNAMNGEPFLLYGLNRHGDYEPLRDFYMEEIGLGLRLWTGSHEGIEDTWLRWCDERGNVILSGAEASRAAREEIVMQRETIIVQREEIFAQKEILLSERERNEKLAAKLREMGVNPDEI
jgi:Uma2 family endonuclease